MFRSTSTRKSPSRYEKLDKEHGDSGTSNEDFKRSTSLPSRAMASTFGEMNLQRNPTKKGSSKPKEKKIHPLLSLFDFRRKKTTTARPEFASEPQSLTALMTLSTLYRGIAVGKVRENPRENGQGTKKRWHQKYGAKEGLDRRSSAKVVLDQNQGVEALNPGRVLVETLCEGSRGGSARRHACVQAVSGGAMCENDGKSEMGNICKEE
ncbi:uncharacterized protein HKW66_Vig0157200 [Vigna angularis]|uniref:Uncharacterized protein n=1 Tax=Phaseolus angularis TaxID=3914 RepID=A0A8T0JL28_PHAAN|nr:uncharacterized protein HKW66_Vig0157200 [Vigna angularis]